MKNTIKQTLRQRIGTGIAVVGIGLMSLVSAGCGRGVKQPVSQEQTYTPEQIKAWYDYMERRNQEIRANNEEWYSYMERRNQEIIANNQNYPTKSQAERDADVIDDMKGRVGGNLATQGLLQFLSDYKK